MINPLNAREVADGLREGILSAYNDALKKNIKNDLVVADATALDTLKGNL